jgi:hypothetical protein
MLYLVFIISEHFHSRIASVLQLVRVIGVALHTSIFPVRSLQFPFPGLLHFPANVGTAALLPGCRTREKSERIEGNWQWPIRTTILAFEFRTGRGQPRKSSDRISAVFP